MRFGLRGLYRSINWQGCFSANVSEKEGFQLKQSQGKSFKKDSKKKARNQSRKRSTKRGKQVKSQGVFSNLGIKFTLSKRRRFLRWSGVAVAHQLVMKPGLPGVLNYFIMLPERHELYMESGHTLTRVYNLFRCGKCLKDSRRLQDSSEFKKIVGSIQERGFSLEVFEKVVCASGMVREGVSYVEEGAGETVRVGGLISRMRSL